MVGLVLFTLFFLLIAYSSRPNRDRRAVYQEISMVIGLLLVLGGFMTSAMKTFIMKDYVLVVFVLIIFYFFYKLYNLDKEKMVVKAMQMSFWGVTKAQLIEKYKDRIVQKRGRTEIKDIKEEYFFDVVNGDKKLRPLVYADVKAYRDFTVFRGLEYFDKQNKNLNPLHKLIYEKMVELEIEAEKGVDFEAKVKENNHILEFYLLDLWEILAKDEILGVATLDVYAKNQRDLDLIGAMDCAINSTSGYLGVPLFLHYANFKGRISSVEEKTLDTEYEVSTVEHITTFEEEVKESLLNVLNAYDKNNKKFYREFILQLSSLKSNGEHGSYTPKTKTIVIYDSINKHKDHLTATALHELAHHVECCDTGESGHSRNFYSILKDLIIAAIGLEEINYKIAYEKNAIDSSDIADMEKLFPDMEKYRQ